MADLSEVKRSNLAILLNNSRTLWPIDVKLSGVMDIGFDQLIFRSDEYLTKMPPRTLGLYV